MIVVLAEKPSVARDIAKCLNANNKKDGYLEGNGYSVTWAFGHLVELKEPEEYDSSLKKWNIETLPIIPDPFQLRSKEDESTQKQLNTIKKLFEGADEIICATDAGREGELIFRYIQSWTQTEAKPFKRLWISSLTTEAITDGFKKLKDGKEFDLLYKAAKCRSEADWIVGINSTRFFTAKYGGYNNLWSIGRVQTPVLAMIVNRDLEILNFQPEDFWELHTYYRDTYFKHTSGKFNKQEKAESKLEAIKDHDLVIKEIKEKKEKVSPPLLYDLTDLQKDMNKRYGLTADDTLKAAQSLYEKKHLTYPRTDSRFLTKDIVPKIPELLEKLKDIKEAEIAPLNLKKLKFSNKIVNDVKVTDHHAIIPTNVIALNLSGDESKVYEAVVTRFISVFYPPCVKSVTTVTAEINKEPFRATGTVILDPGWTALYPSPQKAKKGDGESIEDEQVMPIFAKGESGPHDPHVRASKTSPPKLFTEGTLLNMMETAGKIIEDEELKEALKNKGIGTPATRAAIIEVLIKRNYIARQKKNLISTTGGRQLISLVTDERLKSPELTGEWESNLKKIENEEYDPDKFISEIIEYTKEIIKQNDTKAPKEINLGQCPLCQSPIIRGKKGYGCSGWKDGCKFVLWQDTYGVKIDKKLAGEIIQNRISFNSYLLNVDGEKIYGKIKIAKDGEISYEKTDVILSEKEEVLGNCPACNAHVIETPKAYGCSNWRNGCKFTIWKTISNKEITKEIAKEILDKGETEVFKDFKSKAGKEFSAKLKVIDNEVKFEFENG